MRLQIKDKPLYISNILLRSVPLLIENITILEKYDEIHILINNNNLINLLYFLKNHSLLQFKSLQDIFGVDYLDYIFSLNNNDNNIDLEINKIDTRYQINYYLLSVFLEARILIKINTSSNIFINSASSLFNSAS
jgi:NADH:ubiquinone oxidoreductase subunit C